MIRVVSSSLLLLIVYAMSSTLPKLLLASRKRRGSESEWSKSLPSKPSGSRNAVADSSKDTPCLRRLLRAFRRSQSNMDYVYTVYSQSTTINNGAEEEPLRFSPRPASSPGEWWRPGNRDDLPEKAGPISITRSDGLATMCGCYSESKRRRQRSRFPLAPRPSRLAAVDSLGELVLFMKTALASDIATLCGAARSRKD